MKRTLLIAVVLLGVVAAAYFLNSAGTNSNQGDGLAPTAQDADFEKPDYSGIQVPDIVVRDLKVGEGAEVQEGSRVQLYYEGWIYDPAKLGNRGKKFTERMDEPEVVTIGEGKFVPGWEQGVIGMKQNGKRQLIVPASQAYGKEGVPGKIPSGAILLVEISLHKILEP